MKIDFKQMLLVEALWLFSIIILLWLFGSCSSSFHLKKFYKKGGKIEQTEKTVSVTDTLIVNGKDSIIYRQVSVVCPEPIAPKTRYEIRYQYKTLHDTLELIRYKTKIEYKEAIKTHKNDKKRGFAYNFRLLLVIAGLILLIILLFRFKK